ncbi:hypothetical protein B0H11DRAFT_2229507 [Mycena galericulata]|nr:hypothetical protein B0H11DRAFT_2229507 [Mycena galericulata]
MISSAPARVKPLQPWILRMRPPARPRQPPPPGNALGQINEGGTLSVAPLHSTLQPPGRVGGVECHPRESSAERARRRAQVQTACVHPSPSNSMLAAGDSYMASISLGYHPCQHTPRRGRSTPSTPRRHIACCTDSLAPLPKTTRMKCTPSALASSSSATAGIRFCDAACAACSSTADPVGVYTVLKVEFAGNERE